MSTFKLKPEKVKYVTEIKTLDETHRKIVGEFQRRKLMLPKKKATLQRLKNQLEKINSKSGSAYTNDDIRIRSKLKSDIKNLEDDIYDIENNISEIDYYSKTEELLMDYYALIDKEDDQYYNDHPELGNIKQTSNNDSQELDKLDILNMLNKQKRKQKKITRRRKRRHNDNGHADIMSYFITPPTVSESSATVPESEDQNSASSNSDNNDRYSSNNCSDSNRTTDRSVLLDRFRLLIDNEYICEKNRNLAMIKKCDDCDMDKTLIQSEGIFVCQNCGEVEMIIIEAERPNYKDVVPEKPGYPYKRINHFNEWLSQFQAKESTEIPQEVYEMVLAELHKNRIYDLKKLSLQNVKRILKKLSLNLYYEHTTHIISKLSGLPPPTINRDTEEELRRMFRQIQAPFEKHCPKFRINFLSYSYVLHKFCQLLELDDFIKCFPLLKSREKLRQQDKIWEAICFELRWQFIPSI